MLAKTDLQSATEEKPLQYVGPENQIRSINDEILEAMFAGLLSPTDAVNEASARANHVLLRFLRNTQGE